MTATKVKESIHSLIDKIEDRDLLNAYLKIIEEGVSENPIVGYSTDGEPITKNKLVQRVRSGSDRVKSGDFISQGTLEQDSENW